MTPGHNRIGGETSAEGTRWFQSFDPRTGQATAHRFPEATPEEITQAIELALDAVPWNTHVSSGERARLLRALAEQLERHDERLTAQADLETGLGRDHLVNELAACCKEVRRLADAVTDGGDVGVVLERAASVGTTTGSDVPTRRTVWTGRGPVVVFGSAGAPFLFGVPGRDTMSALAAGCPVISKAHPAHPATAEACARVIDGTLRAQGWPSGGHALLHGQRFSVAEDLVTASGITAAGFTGSPLHGRELFDLANARPDPIPFHARVHSLNPVVVMPGAVRARRDELASQIVHDLTFAGGQSSTRPGLLFVPPDAAGDWFLDAVAVRLRRAKPQPMLTADVHATFATAVAERARLPGVTPLVERVIDADPGYAQDPVLLLVDADDLLSSPQLLKEVFGPLLIAVRTGSDRIPDVLCAFPPTPIAGLHLEAGSDEARTCAPILAALSFRAGRVVVNQSLVAGVAHAGETPDATWPVAADDGGGGAASSVIRRWQRHVTYEGVPDGLLPPALQDANPWDLVRTINGVPTRDPM